MTQLPLWGPDEQFADTLLFLALAASRPLGGAQQGTAYLEAPDAAGAAPLDEAEFDGVYLDEADIRLPYTAEEQYERECYEGDQE